MSKKSAKTLEKLTNGEVFVGVETIAKLLNIDFAVTDALKLRKLKNQLVEAHRLIVEVRDGLIKKYGEELPKGSGNYVIITPGNLNGQPMSPGYLDFLEAHEVLMLAESDVKFDKIKLPSVVGRKPITLSSNDLEKLDRFVEII